MWYRYGPPGREFCPRFTSARLSRAGTWGHEEASMAQEGNGGNKREENERKLSQDGKFRRFASLDAFARWRQRRPRFLLDEKRRRGRRSGGATRKKVYRLQRSEKLRFRSQHRRHSSASFSVPLYPLYMHLSATAATGIWGQHVETATAALLSQFSPILSIIFPSLIFSGRFLFIRYCVLHLLRG